MIIDNDWPYHYTVRSSDWVSHLDI